MHVYQQVPLADCAKQYVHSDKHIAKPLYHYNCLHSGITSPPSRRKLYNVCCRIPLKKFGARNDINYSLYHLAIANGS